MRKLIAVCVAAGLVLAVAGTAGATTVSRPGALTTNFDYNWIQIYSIPGGYFQPVTDIYGTTYPYTAPAGVDCGTYGWHVVAADSSTILMGTTDTSWPYTTDGFRVLAFTLNFDGPLPNGYMFAMELFEYNGIWQAEIEKTWNGTVWVTGNVAYGVVNGLPATGTPLHNTTLIPEPLTMLGMFLGLGSIGAYIRRRRSA